MIKTITYCLIFSLLLVSCNKALDENLDDNKTIEKPYLKDTCWRAAEIDENGIVWCVLSGNTCFVTSRPIDIDKVFFENLDAHLNNTELIKSFVTNHKNIEISIKTMVLNETYLKVIQSEHEDVVVYGIFDADDNLHLAYSYSVVSDDNNE